MNYMDQRRKSWRKSYKTKIIRPKLGRMPENPRNHVICLDGTHNHAKQRTNVHRMHELTGGFGTRQITKYYAGPGNAPQYAKLGEWTGGFSGLGAEFIRNEAYADFVRDYRQGDRVFIFGFSRGAALARTLANLIHKQGIPKKLVVDKDTQSTTVVFRASGKLRPVDVDVLGVWDTVSAFGIPMNFGPIKFQKINLFKNVTVAPNVRHAYHAVSVDEDRGAFQPSLMNHKPGVTEEVWFPGVHSDIGGGYRDNRRLADEPLRYIAAPGYAASFIYFAG